MSKRSNQIEDAEPICGMTNNKKPKYEEEETDMIPSTDNEGDDEEITKIFAAHNKNFGKDLAGNDTDDTTEANREDTNIIDHITINEFKNAHLNVSCDNKVVEFNITPEYFKTYLDAKLKGVKLSDILKLHKTKEYDVVVPILTIFGSDELEKHQNGSYTFLLKIVLKALYNFGDTFIKSKFNEYMEAITSNRVESFDTLKLNNLLADFIKQFNAAAATATTDGEEKASQDQPQTDTMIDLETAHFTAYETIYKNVIFTLQCMKKILNITTVEQVKFKSLNVQDWSYKNTAGDHKKPALQITLSNTVILPVKLSTIREGLEIINIGDYESEILIEKLKRVLKFKTFEPGNVVIPFYNNITIGENKVMYSLNLCKSHQITKINKTNITEDCYVLIDKLIVIYNDNDRCAISIRAWPRKLTVKDSSEESKLIQILNLHDNNKSDFLFQ
ncbi:hypothetical protein MrNuV_ORF012 [Macrobrachium rosenbergii nudivirus]|nr:hypothetical protein MrNuV_ORF012 [Macrobrachium rosenbergii nudivirus]